MNKAYLSRNISQYEDIINLPHHVSQAHPHMTMLNRAAQFSPFAALTGYEDQVVEAARLTDELITLDEGAIAVLNEKLQILLSSIDQKPTATFTYFVPDTKKAGGSYQTITKEVRKIDSTLGIITFQDKTSIRICDVVGIEITKINIPFLHF